MTIQPVAVLAAVVAGAALGALWYSKALFLPAWTAAAGRPPSQNPAVYGVALLAGLAGAGMLSAVLGAHPPLGTALAAGLTAGIGVAALSLGLNYAFAERGWALWGIDAGFHVLRFAVYAVVLALL